jgi:hypothetical protein
MPTFSAPTSIVWDYFLSLRLTVQNAKDAPSPELERQATVLAIVMAVTACEVFLNLWFRVHVENLGPSANRALLLKELNSKISLHSKLAQWPQRYLSAPLDLRSGAAGEFIELKSLRNSIVHFTTAYESIDIGDHTFHGMTNTSVYDSLSVKEAVSALRVAENLVGEIFRLAGVEEERIPIALQAWTGKPPAPTN